MANGLDTHLNRVASSLAPGLAWLVRGRLALPVLLLLASHRPLAFVAGQSLFLLSPLDILLPAARLTKWAQLLSHPEGAQVLEQMLAAAAEEESG